MFYNLTKLLTYQIDHTNCDTTMSSEESCLFFLFKSLKTENEPGLLKSSFSSYSIFSSI